MSIWIPGLNEGDNHPVDEVTFQALVVFGQK